MEGVSIGLSALRLQKMLLKGLNIFIRLCSCCDPRSNILLDKLNRAEVSDFGLSKLAVDGVSHVSSIVHGTVGYLDPDCGVILLELISGQEEISNESFGVNCRNTVQWIGKTKNKQKKISQLSL
ncbi:hypothetical protein RJT34_12845 [Clitoria ternatea]|uniref:Protein kinase domain-containing protein n=1 Tax=Clitoria ternatea TaxID=43366 RepID=A0AAN9PL62_CLITE